MNLRLLLTDTTWSKIEWILKAIRHPANVRDGAAGLVVEGLRACGA